MEVKGKTALVTGGANGIGLACVKELLRNGAQVTVCDLDEAKGSVILKELVNEFGPKRALFIKTDVTNAQEFEEAFKLTISTFKSLDIVLNNAGIHNHENWELMININFNGVVIGTNLALKYMGRNNGGGGGILCNTASVAGFFPVASMPVYAATKFAVVGLTRSYGQPFHEEKTGVRVVAICPGVTDTALFTESASKGDDLANHINKTLAALPAQTPDDVAKGVMTLIRVAESGSIWVANAGAPVYQMTFPDAATIREAKKV